MKGNGQVWLLVVLANYYSAKVMTDLNNYFIMAHAYADCSRKVDNRDVILFRSVNTVEKQTDESSDSTIDYCTATSAAQC